MTTGHSMICSHCSNLDPSCAQAAHPFKQTSLELQVEVLLSALGDRNMLQPILGVFTSLFPKLVFLFRYGQ